MARARCPWSCDSAAILGPGQWVGHSTECQVTLQRLLGVWAVNSLPGDCGEKRPRQQGSGPVVWTAGDRMPAGWGSDADWGVLPGGPSLGLPAHPNSLQAREMTLQAMALQQQPLSPTPRPFPPEVSLAPHECSS